MSLDQLFKLLDEGRPLLDVLKDEQRQELIKVLSYEGELCVNDLSQKVNISRPTVSHHLKILKSVNLVSVRKEGVTHFYQINFSKMIPYLKDVLDVLTHLYVIKDKQDEKVI